MNNNKGSNMSEYVQVQFRWKNKYWVAEFNHVTYDQFAASMHLETYLLLSSPPDSIILDKCEQLKQNYESMIQSSLQSIVFGSSDKSQTIEQVCSVMNCFTILKSNSDSNSKWIDSHWNDLKEVFESPQFEFNRKLISPYELLIRGNSTFSELTEIPSHMFKRNGNLSNINLFVRLKDNEICIPFKLFNRKTLKKQIIKAGNNFETELRNNINKSFMKRISPKIIKRDIIKYCEDHMNVIFDNFNHFKLTNKLIESNVLTILGYVYFISVLVKKDAWEYLRYLGDDSFLIFSLRTFCAFCDKPSPLKRKKCGGCKNNKVFYCSVDCQTKHWPEHKHHCEIRK